MHNDTHHLQFQVKPHRGHLDFWISKHSTHWNYYVISDTKDHRPLRFITNILNRFGLQAPNRDWFISNAPSCLDADFINVREGANFPSPIFFRDYWNGSIQKLLDDESPWTDPRAFFSGNVLDPFNNKSQRMIYERLARENDTLHINNTDIDPPITFVDHKRYRFLVDLHGHAYSSRSLWYLLSRRPTIASDFFPDHYWEQEMIPNVHFFRVQEDLSDLPALMDKLNKDPQLVEEVTRNGFQFGLERFSYENMCFWLLDRFQIEYNRAEVEKRLAECQLSMHKYFKFNRIITDRPEKYTRQGLRATDRLDQLEHHDVLILRKFVNVGHQNWVNFHFPYSVWDMEIELPGI